MALKPVRPCATAELSSELKGMELYLLELPSPQSAKRRVKGPKAKGRRRRRANASGRLEIPLSDSSSRIEWACRERSRSESILLQSFSSLPVS
ncbi:unnamed protein product [Sphagnum balticum]